MVLLTTVTYSSCQTASGEAGPSQTAVPAAAPKPGDIHQNAASLAAEAPAARPEDVKSPEAIVAACYDIISGPAGTRNWDRFRSLFVPNARLTSSAQRPDGSHVVTLLSVDDYVKLAGGRFDKEGFYESSLHNEVLTFGNIGQIFSSYESRKAPGEAPFARGINSFQVLYDGQRWWVLSILWDEERKDNPLPTEFSHK
jgi:hypothetical protein